MKNLARLFVAVFAAAMMLLALSGNAFAQAGGTSLNFDHTTTGYFLDTTHKLVSCESCHTGGVFRGTPRTCATCHAGAGARAPGKPATHIPTSAACDSCHRPGATNWSEKPTGFVRGTGGHAIDPLLGVTATNCQTCHNGAFQGANALTKPATHIQTSAACSTCHGTTSWLPATNPHAGVVPGTCGNCHNGVRTIGKSVAHIPTSSSCDTCHNNFNAFIPASMNHSGLEGQCASCHSGRFTSQNAQAKSLSHLSTAEQCDTCHASTTTWATGVFNHSTAVPSVDGRCSACHKSGGAGLAKPSRHVPTVAECDTCHKNTVTFKPAQMNHSGTNGQCASCHNGAYVTSNALGRSGRHIPTNNQCDTCHVNGFVSWSPARMNHAGLDGMCSSCHSGGYLAQNAQTKPATHIATTAQCDSCHNGSVSGNFTTWATGTFNHSAASPAVAGRCSTCHNSTNALGKPLNHIPTGAQCDSCHKVFTAFTTVSMDHSGSAGKCASCHNGNFTSANAQAQSPTHIPTTATCDTCHNDPTFKAWSPAAMNHTGQNGKCSNCHNGSYVSQNAQAKPATHIDTAAQCDSCHSASVSGNYRTWATGTFSHSGISIGSHACGTSCHTGVSGQGLSKPSNHIPTSTNFCDSCHKNFTAFKPAAMDHAAVTPGIACATCHGGAFVAQNALTKPVTHIQTSVACDSCHGNGYVSWNIISFNHSSANTQGKVCADCHNGVNALGKPSTHIPTTSGCDTCHGTTYTAFKPARMNHATATGVACATCHGGAYTAQGALAQPTSHIPATGACDSCHKNSNFVNWAPSSMDHTGLTQCSTCHSGTYLAQNAQTKPATHQATNAQCSDCHRSTTTWATATQNHALLNPPVTIGDHTCGAACHNGTANKGLAKPATHIPTTAACDTCHTNFTAFTPAAMNHTGTVGQCSTCHGGAYVSVNALTKPATHVSTTAQCDTCHGSTTSWATVAYAHDATSFGRCSTCHNGTTALGKPTGHIPTPIANQQCSDCHKNFTSFKPAQMSHVATVGLCSTCHNASYVSKNALDMPVTHIRVTEQCDTCHKSGYINWAPATMDHTAPSVLAQTCATCHSGAYLSQNAQMKPATHQSTTAPCSDCHTSRTSWATVTQDHSRLSPPVTIGDHTCNSCHNGTPNKGLSKPGTHIPTTAACDNCHKTFTAFAPAAMDHTGTAGACANCHNGAYTAVNAQAKKVNHIATTQSCDVCHATTAWKPTTFSHQGVSAGSCATCHNGTTATGKPAAHIPTSAACDTCHKNYIAFAPAQMNHTGLAGQCATCHSGTYLSVNAQIKPSTHVATSAQCDTCHTSTTSWATATYVHPASATGTCSTCHGTTALGKPTNHIPTTAQCDTCHGNFTAFKPAQMNHAGTAGKCSWCHGGNYLFANALTKPTGHIPTLDQCDSCHRNGYVNWSPATMDHTLANVVSQGCSTCHGGAYVAQNAQTKPATHQSTTAQCSSCHTSTATWATATQNHALLTPPAVIGDHSCGGACHNGTPNKGLSKPTTHIPTSAACDNCHKNFTAFAPAAMDHTGTTGACATCHSGAYTALNAQTKPSSHIQTTQSCDACHSTTAWRPANYSHGTVAAGSCATCHNGSSALGKPSTHIPVTAACDNCHKNFVAFAPAQMNHTGLAGQCSTCHSGAYLSVNAQTKSATHAATTAQCDTCHSSTTSWATATFVHANPPGVCSTCHNGTTALGKSSTHIPTSATCDTCHKNFVAFKPAQMDHTGLAGQCTTCHGGAYVAVNALAKPVTHIPVSAQCDGCHKNGFANWSPATMDHTLASVVAQGCSTCHGGAYVSQNAQTKPATHQLTTAQCSSCHTTTTTWATATQNHALLTPPANIGDHSCGVACHNGAPNKGLSKPTTHIPTSAFCDNCHKNFTAFAPAAMDHTGTTGACATCHSGAYVSLNALAKPSTHIPTTQSCDTCHSTTVWRPAVYSHTGVVAGSCATCHNGTNAQGKNLTHIPTSAACDSCHKNYTAFAPAAMNHAGTTGQCSTCHGGAYLAVNALAKPATHVSTTAQCDTCHASTTAWANPRYTHPATATGTCSTCHSGGVTGAQSKSATHIPTTAQCDTCHKNYTTFSPATMSHTGTAGRCSTCHNGSYLAQNALAKTVGHIPTSQSCDLCHTNFTAFSGAVMNHTGTAAQCLTCHTGGYTTQGTQGAQVKPATHIATTDSCDNCHSTSAWLPASFAHTAAQMGTRTCASCHNGTTATGKPALHIPTSEACSVCHRTGIAWLPLITPYAHTTVAVGSCTSCHVSSFPSMDFKPAANHVPTTASCDACHLKTTWTTLGTFNHTGAVNCDTCHTGTYTGVVGKNAISNHIPTTVAGLPGNLCSNCHASKTTFTTERMNHGTIQTGCRTCHSRPASYAINGADTVTIGSHEGSRAGDDCSKSGCHKPLGSKGTPYTRWK